LQQHQGKGHPTRSSLENRLLFQAELLSGHPRRMSNRSPKKPIRDQKNCNYSEEKDVFGDVMEEQNNVSRDEVTSSRLSAVLRT
jgi:hypothetical protein